MRTVWAQTERGRRLYLVDADCAFVRPVQQYLDSLAALERSPHTLEGYCRHLAHFFAFLAERGRDWAAVTPDDLVGFVQWLRRPRPPVGAGPARAESPRTERTVNTILAAVGSFYRYHLQRGVPLANPVVSEQAASRTSGFKHFLIHTSRGPRDRLAVTLKAPRRRPRTLADDDFARFLAATDNLQFRCILLLLREGGLRTGEVLGLWIQDVEHHAGRVWVRRRADLENGALAKGLVAGEERPVDLAPAVLALLDRLILGHTFDTDHLFVVRKRDARDRLGHPTYGRPLGRDALRALFRHYSAKTGIALHPHMLRHSHATELIRAGWDASYVRQRLGHRQVQTTIDTYVHLDDADLRAKWRAYQEGRDDAAAGDA